MNIGLYLLIPLSVVLVFVIGIIFWWSVRSGQYDDLEGPAYRLLLDDRDPPTPGSEPAGGNAPDAESVEEDVPRGGRKDAG